jgi:2,3-bisphosphoglycerate-independent phosphoglycerate mutase
MPAKQAKNKNKELNKSKANGRLTLLIILDGFGLADADNKGNAITPKTAPKIFGYMKNYASLPLNASGKEVGLQKNQQGNSEAGHFNIGAGRLIKQDLVHISEAIDDGRFFKNEAFKQALKHAKKYNTAVHVFALLTHENSVHTSPKHLYAALEYLRRKKHNKVFLHLFTDGRDSSPHGAATFLHKLRGNLQNHEKIATITGRFYAMDRNKLWSRTYKTYLAIVAGKGCTAPSAEEAIEQAYNRGESDEYICPTIITEKGKPLATVNDNDVIFFINARSDRARQLTKAFVQPDFERMNPGTFTRKRVPKNIRFVAMTDFGPDLPGIFTAFPSADVKNSLACVIGNSYKQLYISESEKYAHVTYFINGGFADPINGEERILVRSPKIKSYADQPEMNTKEMTDAIIKYIEKNVYSFITINFPNVDMVGHTGNFEAAKQAVKVVDSQVDRIVKLVLKKEGQVVIVGDHGNAEEMIDLKTSEIVTEHSINPVPCIMISKGLKGKQAKKSGKLADVAPTLLRMMGLKKPVEMSGKSLI